MRKIIGISGSSTLTVDMDGKNSSNLELYVGPDGTVKAFTAEQENAITHQEQDRTTTE